MLRVALALIRASLMGAMQYRASFVSDFLMGIGGSAAIVLPLIFVYDHATEVAGWSFNQALLVTAFFLVHNSIVGMLVAPNLGALVEDIRSGRLDQMLVKPADAQLLISVRQVAPGRSWDLLAGVGVAAWALSHGAASPSAWEWLLSGLLLACGTAAMYSIWLIVASTSFWWVKVDNLQFFLGALEDAGRWPIDVYKGWIRTGLTVLLPVALVTSFPAMALLGRIEGTLLAEAIAVTATLLVASRLCWKLAIRHYSGVGG